ncbi:MAG: cadherin-like domain-containing protein, partial [Rhodobacteraceae bacterium]|nr:cadherin-like domain-containing protein [Paracoccaceae bacterium]
SAEDVFQLEFTPVNDAPVGTSTAILASGTEDTAYTVTLAQLLAGFSDVDGDMLSVTTLSASNGTAVQNTDGNWTITPAGNFNGTMTLSYTVSDGTATIPGSLTYNVSAVNDAPVVTTATGQNIGTVEDPGERAAGVVAGTLTATGQLTATDEDTGDVLYWATGSESNYGTFTITEGGLWTFTLDPAKANSLPENAVITETFTAVVKDGKGGSASQTVTITINGTNDAPVIVLEPSASVVTGSISAQGGQATVAGRVVGIDPDQGDTVSHSILGATNGVATGTYGSLTMSSAFPNNWIYTLNADDPETRALAAGQTGTETFTIQVTDGQGVSRDQTVTITVTGANDAPVLAVPIADQTGTEDTPFTFTVPPGTFTDVDNATLTYSLGNDTPTWLSINATTGVITATPPANFDRDVRVSVVVTDAGGLSAEDVFQLEFTPVNDAPVGTSTAILASGTEDTAYTVTLAQLLAGFS